MAPVVLLFIVALTQTSCPHASANALFLTPFIESGRILEAQSRSRVHDLSDDGSDVDSYAGYITVNKTYNSNIFFWFFPSETNPSDAPVVLWLNGGPSRTSLIGALLENGPYQLTKDGKIERRPVAWTQSFSMLYLDNPVNAGYSFTEDDAGMSTSTEDTAVNLYSALVQFFKLFPRYSKNDFYIGGQSYAGKYVPVLGCYIHDRNIDTNHIPELRINFKGIYLGAGYCDPENMMPAFPDYFYNFGVLSDATRLQRRSDYAKLIKDGLYGNASRTTTDYLSKFFDVGLESMDHIMGRESTNLDLINPLGKFMDSWTARTKLHAGFSKTSDLIISLYVANKLTDLLSSTSRQNAFLMDNYKVLHFSGNLDGLVNIPMMEAFLTNVTWSGQDEYRNTDRQQWRLDGQLMGWVATVRNLTRVVIRNCGHMVPYDQPKAALEMMKRFVFGQPFEIFNPPPCVHNFCNEHIDADGLQPDYFDLPEFEV